MHKNLLIAFSILLLLFAAVLGAFYFMFKDNINNMLGIGKDVKDKGSDTGNQLDDLFGCKDTTPDRCDYLQDKMKTCEEGKWVITERPCPESDSSSG